MGDTIKYGVCVEYVRLGGAETETVNFSDAASAIEFAKRQNKIRNVVKATYLGAKK